MNFRLNLFEDQKRPNFHPLTLTRPIWDLRVGILTLAEKWKLLFPNVLIYGELRPEFSGVHQEKIEIKSFSNSLLDPDVSLSGKTKREESYSNSTHYHDIRINSRYLPSPHFVQKLKLWMAEPDQIIDFIVKVEEKETLVAQVIPDPASTDTSIKIILEDEKLLEYPWDLLEVNGDEILRDIERITDVTNNEFSVGLDSHAGCSPNVYVDEPNALYIHPTAVVEPGVTIQTHEGPVWIGENAHIMAGSHLKGPLSIGSRAVVKMGSLLYKNSTIGPHCKVGGEVSNCIFHSFSNKAHHGYAGNSIFGQWVNLGAGTTTSNLRGNYSEIRVREWQSDREIPTGRQFLGSIMGDHVKTGINTILNTGTIIGPSSMIFGAGFAPKWIRSFSWINSDSGESSIYDVEKSLIDMQRMMSRRDVELSDAYAKLIRKLSNS